MKMRKTVIALITAIIIILSILAGTPRPSAASGGKSGLDSRPASSFNPGMMIILHSGKKEQTLFDRYIQGLKGIFPYREPAYIDYYYYIDTDDSCDWRKCVPAVPVVCFM